MGRPRFQFITAIPWNVRLGSGCYVGTRKLAEALRSFGIDIQLIRPASHTPFFTSTRLLFNETLRWRRFDGAATIGVDADGYAIARDGTTPPHIACIKGVLADAVRFETGVTRASLAFQARLEKRHARRADLVITVSRYCAGMLEEFYGVNNAVVVPELIDVKGWDELFAANPAAPPPVIRSAPGRKVAVAAPPPPPPPHVVEAPQPYRVEAIRASKRTEEVVR